MSTFRDLSQAGITAKSNEVRLRSDVIEFRKSLTVDKSLVCEYSGNVQISGDLAITGTLVLPYWANRKYIEIHSGPLDALIWYPVVIPVNGYIRTLRSVIDGDPGAQLIIGIAKQDPFGLSTSALTIANGSAAGDVDIVDFDWTVANDADIMACIAGDYRMLWSVSLAANPVHATFLIELADTPT